MKGFPASANTGQPGRWRQRADNLRALAKATPQPTAKAELLDLAQQWDGLADKAEQRKERKPIE